MNQTGTYKILLIELNADLKDRIQTLLASGSRYLVHSFSDEKEALTFLETSEKGSFALIISSYKMSGMKGDEILLKARELSPDSRRMLVGDMSDIDTMVNAINKADIHYCLALPFMDSELIQQVQRACLDFQGIKKLENLKRVTQRQNKQLFIMASELKKKNENDISQIKSRQARIKELTSKLPDPGDSKQEAPLLSLTDVLIQREADFSSKGFGYQFALMQEQIRQMFEKASFDSVVQVQTISYEQVRNKSATTPEYRSRAIRMMPVILNGLILGQEASKTKERFSNVMPFDGFLSDYLELGISPDGLKAYIRVKKKDMQLLNLSSIKECLAYNHIISGLLPDQQIESWLKETTIASDPFVIAQGKSPTPPYDAEVEYHFPVDYRQPGTLRPDGSLDFTDRGKVPYVQKDTLLAEKKFAVSGIPGRTVSGDDIPVPEPEDIIFTAGSGTRLSEDGTRIYADADGQPHLDSMGNVTVLSELVIKGDIGFETGNIEFEGNLIVKGTIQQGFRVKAASLTIGQIQGAEVILTGDLNVSAGIVDAHLVKVGGNVQAKYINNSVIDAFGDLRIQNEIIDSTIRLSGRCINPTGTIISSQISAKLGIEAGNIGTAISNPSKLVVGVDAYVESLVGRIKSKQDQNRLMIGQLKNEIIDLEKENQDLHGNITQYAYTQDRSQLELKELNLKLSDLKNSGDIQAFHKGSQAVHILEEKIKEAEEAINKGFERQDEIAVETAQKISQIQILEKNNETLESEKQGLNDLADKKEPIPRVKVAKKIMPGTRINGPHSFMVIHETASRCEIAELKRQGENMDFHEMRII